MSEYRNRTTGALMMSKEEVQATAPNMRAPKVWNDKTLDSFNVDPVFETPKPTSGIGQYQHVVRDGVEQDAKGNWVQVWKIVDMFADIDGGQTKKQQEDAYQTKLDNDAAKRNRLRRNSLLQETDWWAVSDRTMTSAQTTYRAALRDLPDHSNWPHLEYDDWPTKP